MSSSRNRTFHRLLTQLASGGEEWTDDQERTLRTLLRQGVPVPSLSSIERPHHHSVLVGAIRTGMADLVPLLLDHGADPHKQGHLGQDALHAALFYFSNYEDHPTPIEDTLRVLLERGVDPYAFSSEGNGSVMEMAAMNHPYLLALLVEFSGSERLDEPVNENGDTALMVASRLGYHESVWYLLEHGATVDLPNQAGNTPLHYAISELRYPHPTHDPLGRVYELVRYGADLELANKEGKTPLDPSFLPTDSELRRLDPGLTRNVLRSTLMELAASSSQEGGRYRRMRKRKTRRHHPPHTHRTHRTHRPHRTHRQRRTMHFR